MPFETRSPFVTSGIRIGTPAVTTRGMKEKEMKIIANLILKVLDNVDELAVHHKVAKEVKELCSAFPLYKGVLF